jgi:hypothetical protein
MFVSGVELGFWPGDFGFLGAKQCRRRYCFAPSRECLDQFTDTMLNTVLFVRPISVAIVRRELPAA